MNAKLLCRLILILVFAVSWAAVARADLRCTLTAHLGGVTADSVPDLSSDLAFQGQMERSDSTIGLNGAKFHIVNIADGAAGKLTTYDPALKIYTVQNLTDVRCVPLALGCLLPCHLPGGNGLLMPLPLARDPAVVLAVSVADHGMEKVGRAEAHHWTITWTGDAADAPFDSVELWTNDSEQLPLDPLQASAMASGGEITGQTDLLKTALSAEPVKIEVILASANSRPGGTVTYDVRDGGAKPISGTVFAIPVNAKLVSEQDFLDAEKNAFVPRLTAGSDLNPTAPVMQSNGPNQDDGSDQDGSSPTAPEPGSYP